MSIILSLTEIKDYEGNANRDAIYYIVEFEKFIHYSISFLLINYLSSEYNLLKSIPIIS